MGERDELNNLFVHYLSCVFFFHLNKKYKITFISELKPLKYF